MHMGHSLHGGVKRAEKRPWRWFLQILRSRGKEQGDKRHRDRRKKIQLDWQEDTYEKSSVRTCFQKRKDSLLWWGKLGGLGAWENRSTEGFAQGTKPRAMLENPHAVLGGTDDRGEGMKLRKLHSPSPVPHASISYRNKYRYNMPKPTQFCLQRSRLVEKDQGTGGLNRYFSFKFLEPAPV